MLHRWYFFRIWNISKPHMVDFFKFTEQVHLLHSTALLAMKFTAEISDTETIFLDPVVYQGTTFNEKWEKAIIDVKTNLNGNLPVYTFSPLTTHRMLKWIWPMDLALSILRTNSSEEVFQISKSGWWTEAGHKILKEKLLLEVKLTEEKQRSWNKTIRKKKKYCLSWHNTSPCESRASKNRNPGTK